MKNILVAIHKKSSSDTSTSLRKVDGALCCCLVFVLGFLVFSGLFLWVPSAFAIQAHGGREGFYVHQGAHLFWVFSIGRVACGICASSAIEERAWRFIATGFWLLTAWNLWAFTGHIVEELIPKENFIAHSVDGSPLFLVDSWVSMAYYVLKMDHLVCVPALAYLYFGLRAMASDLPDRPADGSGRLS